MDKTTGIWMLIMTFVGVAMIIAVPAAVMALIISLVSDLDFRGTFLWGWGFGTIGYILISLGRR